VVLSSEEGIPTVREMFKQLGLSQSEADQRIIVLGDGLEWAGGPAASRKPQSAGLLRMEDLLRRGVLKQEEQFEGKDAHDTVYLCYSSGIVIAFDPLIHIRTSSHVFKGTTGKPKGVEVAGLRMCFFIISELECLFFF